MSVWLGWCGVFDDVGHVFEAASSIDPFDGGEVRAGDGMGRGHDFLQSFPLQDVQVAKPGQDAASQYTLYCAPVAVQEDPP